MALISEKFDIARLEIALATYAIGSLFKRDGRMFLMPELHRWLVYSNVSDIEAVRDVSCESVVTIEGEGAEKLVAVAGRLTLSDHDRPTFDEARIPTCDGSIRDALDQDVSLCAKTDHGSPRDCPG
jgi:hypothetical protein